MNISQAFPSKWMKASDLPDDSDTVLTMAEVSMETIQGQSGPEEAKPVLYFQENDKGLVLNKTNANTISDLYGPETKGWTGKKIALFTTETEFAGKQVLAIRVRMRAPRGGQVTAEVAPTEEEKTPF